MATNTNEFQHRDVSGRYSTSIKCDCCGKPVKPAGHVTDDEVCAGGDGPGFYLCHRARCGKKYEALSIEQRRELFTTQRAKNEQA